MIGVEKPAVSGDICGQGGEDEVAGVKECAVGSEIERAGTELSRGQGKYWRNFKVSSCWGHKCKQTWLINEPRRLVSV